jgi:hypothetical protein
MFYKTDAEDDSFDMNLCWVHWGRQIAPFKEVLLIFF